MDFTGATLWIFPQVLPLLFQPTNATRMISLTEPWRWMPFDEVSNPDWPVIFPSWHRTPSGSWQRSEHRDGWTTSRFMKPFMASFRSDFRGISLVNFGSQAGNHTSGNTPAGTNPTEVGGNHDLQRPHLVTPYGIHVPSRSHIQMLFPVVTCRIHVGFITTTFVLGTACPQCSRGQLVSFFECSRNLRIYVFGVSVLFVCSVSTDLLLSRRALSR